ncbi:hypothetical protein [Mycobacterium sp.]
MDRPADADGERTQHHGLDRVCHQHQAQRGDAASGYTAHEIADAVGNG